MCRRDPEDLLVGEGVSHKPGRGAYPQLFFCLVINTFDTDPTVGMWDPERGYQHDIFGAWVYTSSLEVITPVLR
jgi:hypothetical protein